MYNIVTTMKKQYIHFTQDSHSFTLENGGGSLVSQDADGIYVYEYTENFPVAERSAKWNGREPIIIECEENLINFEQDDPLGNDRTFTEYVIPASVFSQCNWWKLAE